MAIKNLGSIPTHGSPLPGNEVSEARRLARRLTGVIWRCRTCGYQHTGSRPPALCACGAEGTGFEGRSAVEWRRPT